MVQKRTTLVQWGSIVDFSTWGIPISGCSCKWYRCLSCPISVEEDEGCNGSFPLILYPELNLDVLTLDNVLLTGASPEVNNFEVHWNGNGGNIFWHDPDNWEFGAIPNQCQHVIIPTEMQVVVVPGIAAQIWRLTLKSDAQLMVNDSTYLKIVGN